LLMTDCDANVKEMPCLKLQKQQRQATQKCGMM